MGSLGLAILVAAVMVRSPVQLRRDFFAVPRGIGVADPAPDKNGYFTMPVEFNRAMPGPENEVISWKAHVVGDKIELRAYRETPNVLQRWIGVYFDEFGPSIPYHALPDGQYQVIFIDPERAGHPIAMVRPGDDFGGERRWR